MSSADQSGIIAWFVRNPVAANLLMALIVILGFASATTLPREGFPSFEPSRITVTVEYPSGSPRIAEEGVTLKIEEALSGLPGVKETRSVSRADGVTVTVTKASGASLDELLAEVKSRVDAIPNLPARAERPTIRKQRDEEYVLWVQLEGNVEPDVLNRLARSLQRDLVQKASIQKAVLAGHRQPEIHIEVNERRLQEYGLSLADLSDAIGSEALTELSGQIRGPDGSLSVRADNPAFWARDFGDVAVVTRQNGSVLKLRDIATLREGHSEDQQVWMRFNGESSIGLQVFAAADGGPTEAKAEVEALLQTWRDSGRVPETITLATWNDRSEQVRGRISLLLKNAALGTLLVFALLALTLELRIAFWVAMGLPVAFGGTLLLMNESLVGLSLNDLTTFGMIVALGIVVDDAVVVGESVYSERQKGQDAVGGTIAGVKRVSVPTVFGVLTTIAAFGVLPLVEGDLGRIFSQFALVVAACLAFSILESKLILPAHLAHSLSKNGARAGMSPRATRIASAFSWLGRHYRTTMRLALQNRLTTFFLFATLAVAIVGLVTRGYVRTVFFPAIPGSVITASLTMEEAAGYALTEDALAKLERSLRQSLVKLRTSEGHPVHLAVQTHLSTDRAGVVSAELARSEGLAITPEELVDAWRAETPPLEGARDVAFSAIFEPFPAISLELNSADEGQLREAHKEILDALLAFEGVSDLRDNMSPGRSELNLALNSEGRARGLTAASVAGQVQQAFRGYEIQRVQRGVDEVRVRLRYPATDRRDITSLSSARIRTPDGGIVPLSQVADTTIETSVNEITRIRGRRVATIVGGVDKKRISTAEVLAHLDSAVFPEVRQKYPSVIVRKAGEAEEMEAAQSSLLVVVGIAIAAIYSLIAIPTKSYTQALIIMSVIPFAMLGAIIGHWVHSLPISLLSTFGMVALGGVVVNDSLLLLTTFNALQANGSKTLEALIESGSSRLRPVLVTSITTFAGLAPLVRESSEQAQYLIPAAVALGYGVLFATAVTLVLIPLLLSVREDLLGAEEESH